MLHTLVWIQYRACSWMIFFFCLCHPTDHIFTCSWCHNSSQEWTHHLRQTIQCCKLILFPAIWIWILGFSVSQRCAGGLLGRDPFTRSDLSSGTLPFFSVRHTTSLSSFKSKLKTHLFSSAYWFVIFFLLFPSNPGLVCSCFCGQCVYVCVCFEMNVLICFVSAWALLRWGAINYLLLLY